MSRYVILRHDTPAGHSRPLHWDFMLQAGDVLRTWALAGLPRAADGITAESLPDHRIAYLDYEGPVSGDRGTVTRWDEGEYQVVMETDREIVVSVDGRRLTGTVQLERLAKGAPNWLFTYSAGLSAAGQRCP